MIFFPEFFLDGNTAIAKFPWQTSSLCRSSYSVVQAIWCSFTSCIFKLPKGILLQSKSTNMHSYSRIAPALLSLLQGSIHSPFLNSWPENMCPGHNPSLLFTCTHFTIDCHLIATLLSTVAWKKKLTLVHYISPFIIRKTNQKKKEKDWRTEMGPYYFAITLHKQPWTLLSSE